MSILSTTVHLQRSKILSNNTQINHHLAHTKSLNSNPSKRSISIKKPDRWPAPHGTKNSSGPGEEEDFGKPGRVHGLHSAIKNRSIKECLDLAGKECRDCFNSLQAIDPFEWSKVRTNLCMTALPVQFFCTRSIVSCQLLGYFQNNKILMFHFILQPANRCDGYLAGAISKEDELRIQINYFISLKHDQRIKFRCIVKVFRIFSLHI